MPLAKKFSNNISLPNDCLNIVSKFLNECNSEEKYYIPAIFAIF